MALSNKNNEILNDIAVVNRKLPRVRPKEQLGW